MWSRWPGPTQRCLKSQEEGAQSEPRSLGPAPDSCRKGSPWACAGHQSCSHMVLSQGEGLPQEGEQAAHKALGARATWGRSWKGSAKQRHTALRRAE